MLGEQFSDERGQITARRVLPSETGPKIEISFEASGTLLGQSHQNMGTYIAVARPDGTIFGDGQGVSMTTDGDMVAWKGQGVGHFVRPGAVAYRGAIYFEGGTGKLAPLNGTCAVYEYASDEGGKTESTLWEWK